MTFDAQSPVGRLLTAQRTKFPMATRRLLNNYAYIMENTDLNSPDGAEIITLAQLFAEPGNFKYLDTTKPPTVNEVIQLAQNSILPEQQVKEIIRIITKVTPAQYIKLLDATKLYLIQ